VAYWRKIEPYITEVKYGMTEKEVKNNVKSAQYIKRIEGMTHSWRGPIFDTKQVDYIPARLIYTKPGKVIEYLFSIFGKLHQINELEPIDKWLVKQIGTIYVKGGPYISIQDQGIRHCASQLTYECRPIGETVEAVLEKEKEKRRLEQRAWDSLTPRMKEKVRQKVLKDFAEHPEKYEVREGTIHLRPGYDPP
jgi:hypothetical protein